MEFRVISSPYRLRISIGYVWHLIFSCPKKKENLVKPVVLKLRTAVRLESAKQFQGHRKEVADLRISDKSSH